jgi:hypothetical protein
MRLQTFLLLNCTFADEKAISTRFASSFPGGNGERGMVQAAISFS